MSALHEIAVFIGTHRNSAGFVSKKRLVKLFGEHDVNHLIGIKVAKQRIDDFGNPECSVRLGRRPRNSQSRHSYSRRLAAMRRYMAERAA